MIFIIFLNIVMEVLSCYLTLMNWSIWFLKLFEWGAKITLHVEASRVTHPPIILWMSFSVINRGKKFYDRREFQTITYNLQPFWKITRGWYLRRENVHGRKDLRLEEGKGNWHPWFMNDVGGVGRSTRFRCLQRCLC